jgi:hypothetical protein
VAETFEVRTQYPTVEFLGGSQTRPVMAIGYVTKPSLIYLEVRIPKNLYSAELVKDYGIGYSGTVEAVAQLNGVQGMVWQQAQQPDGTLIDQMVIYVSSTSGDSAGSFILPFGQLAPKWATPKIKALRDQLDEAEAS